MTEVKFEETKDTPLGRTTQGADEKFTQLEYSQTDFYNYFPCFIGTRMMARYLSLYECYRATLGLSGHIAEVGVFRGGVSLFFAKLSLLHEPHTTTQVHGFDWFRDDLGSKEEEEIERKYAEPFERINEMIHIQGLQRWVLLHRLNVITELEGFFHDNSHLQFKLVMLDCGEYYQVARSIREFWPRLVPGGIMIFDQFNHELAPGETQAVRELLPEDAVIRGFPHGWMPTAYVVKGEKVGEKSSLSNRLIK